jgi:hypothetical protein
MARYIDADLLLERIYPYNGVDQSKYAINAKAVFEAIRKSPTADVVEVVRCKDCKYKTVTSDGEYNPEDIVCEYFMSDGFRETDFCSYGERVE